MGKSWAGERLRAGWYGTGCQDHHLSQLAPPQKKGRETTTAKRQQHNNKCTTCNGRFNVDHGLLLAEEGGALVDDPQGGRFLDATLEDKVLLEDIRPRFARLSVEHFGHR